MTAMLQMVAPLAVLLEGGYNLSATAAGTEACLRVLLGERPPPLPQTNYLNSLAMMAIQSVLQHQVCPAANLCFQTFLYGTMCRFLMFGMHRCPYCGDDARERRAEMQEP